MKLKLRAFDAPLHPLLVHFPIAFWLVVPVLDIAALYAGPDPWWTLAQAATTLGFAIGAASIAVGLLEYLQPSTSRVSATGARSLSPKTTLIPGRGVHGGLRALRRSQCIQVRHWSQAIEPCRTFPRLPYPTCGRPDSASWRTENA
jgi:hypothetical protein